MHEGRFDVIACACNCQRVMMAGIARSIKALFPAAYEADCQTAKVERSKLGTCSFADCPTPSDVVTVVNAYTQFHWRGRGLKADYNAIRSCMAWIKANYPGKRIGLPKIGAGLAGGDWSIISAIIAEELSDEAVTIVEYQP